MRLVIASVGRLKAGPERALFDRYATRARALARSAGVTALDLVEVDEGRGRSAPERRREEGGSLLARLPAGGAVLALDERGPSPTSAAFAADIRRWAEAGTPALAFAVGGPDGFDDAFRAGARGLVGFGAATLPHGLARVLLAEQVYRALTILAGHPYHRA